ncbi:pilus assembly protein [Janibacter cremeus]|uniref:TadE/TadG family type IV pilus assembly protein n=1 Tax=Janibacter cremeus TaxID=1285192 RepID=UPI0023F6F2FD|nr:TadE/TadG family type IV pilus assembly protein [Janibacter cremeus]WEV76995.1 pilus assembly protein [Janibacter cremeus]
MRATSRAGWQQRGAAAVEMAIMLPLLLLVIGGIVDFGRYFLQEVQLTNAAREGVRVAVIGEADVFLRVQAAAPGIPALTMDPAAPACAGAGTTIEITVADPDFDWILLGPAMSFFGGSATSLPDAESTAAMRCEV